MPAPSVPAWGLQPEESDFGDYDLAWQAATGIVDYHQLQERMNAGAWSDVPLTNNLDYEARGKIEGEYDYQVRACNVDGCSAWSSAQTVRVHNLQGVQPAVTIANADTPGTVAYSTDVTTGGSGLIRIPLNVVPGVNAMAPSLSIDYSSGRGRQQIDEELAEDILGYGWEVSGLSAIRRCVKNRTDLTKVQLTTADSLCLDGEPLVLVSGTHWQPGASYRTLRDSFIKVELKGTAEEPWFQLSSADGNTMEYGNTPDSRVRVTDASTQSLYFTWSLNSDTDAFGNTITYSYHKDELNGINYPLSIRYGEVDSFGDGDAEVSFYYMRRDDAVAVPLADIEQGQLVMLHTIKLTLTGKMVREYRLASELAPEGWRRLDQVQECGFDESGIGSSCLPALDFDWVTAGILIPEDFKTGVERITDGLGAVNEFQYQVMTNGGSEAEFSERPFGNEIVPPDSAEIAPAPDGSLRSIVTEFRRSNGLGGFHRTTYAYHGRGLMSTKNWGFLGYYAQRVVDEESGIVTYRQRRLDYPFFGRISALHQYNGVFGSHSEVLTREEYAYGSHAITHSSGAISQFPYVSKGTHFLYESGTELGAKEESNFYDIPADLIAGTATTQRVAKTVTQTNAGGSYWGNVPSYSLSDIARTVESDLTFTNRTGSGQWLIGFADSLEVRHYRGDAGASLDRTESVSMSPYGNTNAMESVVRFPGDTEYELTTSYSYDSTGNRTDTTVTGVNVPSRTSSALSFVASRYPTMLRDAKSQDSSVAYDLRFGKAKYFADPNGRATELVFDPFGREISRTTPDNVLLTTDYDFCALVGCDNVGGIAPALRVQTQSAITPSRSSYYDELGRTLRSDLIAFNGTTSIYRDSYYDSQGRLDRYSQPYFSADAAYFNQLTYDLRNRVIDQQLPSGGSVIINYQADVASGGVQVDVTETVLAADGSVADTHTKRSLYNLLEELNSTTDDSLGLAVTTAFEYDASGLPLMSTVDGSQSTSFTYDVAGKRTSISGPNIGAVTSQYTALGQLRYQEDNKGQGVTYTYDLLGRLLTQVDVDGTASWNYDPVNAIGALESRSYGNGFTETYSYNSDSKLTQIDTQLVVPGYSKSYTHGYTYDGYGRIDTKSYPSGLQTQSLYNSQGYLAAINNLATATALQTFADMDAFGNVNLEHYGNGVQTHRVYASQTGQLQSIDTDLGATVLQNNDYSWRSNGTLESRNRTEGSDTTSETFNYDTLSRLSVARTFLNGSLQRELQYDFGRLGNLLSKTSSVNGDNNATGYQYGDDINNGTANAGPNAVTAVTLNGNSYNLAYDANGNLTHYDALTGSDKFIAWNARNLPVTITVGDSELTSNPSARDSFLYGPDGQRYYKQGSYDDGGTLKTEHTFYVGDFEEIVTDSDPDFAAILKTSVGDSLIHVKTVSHTSVIDESIEYLHRGHQGSVEAVTDEDGNLLYSLAYDPYGGRRNSDWMSDISQAETDVLLAGLNITTSRGYTGHEHLDRTGFIHMNGRVYDPQLGRFLSPDPIVQSPGNSQSYNRYSYVFNNPMQFTDPTGYEAGYEEEVTVTEEPMSLDFYYPSFIVGAGASSPRRSDRDSHRALAQSLRKQYVNKNDPAKEKEPTVADKCAGSDVCVVAQKGDGFSLVELSKLSFSERQKRWDALARDRFNPEVSSNIRKNEIKSWRRTSSDRMYHATKQDAVIVLGTLSLATGVAGIYGGSIILSDVAIGLAVSAAVVDPSEGNLGSAALAIGTRGLITPLYGETAGSIVDGYNTLYSASGIVGSLGNK